MRETPIAMPMEEAPALHWAEGATNFIIPLTCVEHSLSTRKIFTTLFTRMISTTVEID